MVRSKFNVGDRVKIVDNENVVQKYRGCYGTIRVKHPVADDVWIVVVDEDGEGGFKECWLSPAGSAKIDAANAADGNISSTSAKIDAKCAELAVFLKRKNDSYGDSALHPINVFSTANAGASLHSRMDDKLSRIKVLRAGGDGCGEGYKDSVNDLAGYLILELIRLDEEGKS